MDHYATRAYLMDGDRIPRYIIEDRARGNDLLSRKYDWLKAWIFEGVEFSENAAER